jgi:hypothetical protein
MARCDSCGNECTLPFTCQYCGNKFCPECRLPPNHQCTGLTSWQKKPAPGVGLRYGREGGVTATRGGYGESRPTSKGKPGKEIPWLKVMIAIMLIIILVILFLVISGYPLQ